MLFDANNVITKYYTKYNYKNGSFISTLYPFMKECSI